MLPPLAKLRVCRADARLGWSRLSEINFRHLLVFRSLVIVIVCTYYRLGQQERELATGWKQRAQIVGHSLGAGELVTGWEHKEVLVIGWMEGGINQLVTSWA